MTRMTIDRIDCHVPNPCNNVGVIGDSKVYEGLYHEGTGNVAFGLEYYV